MEANNPFQKLEKQLSLTKPEPEQYILTPEEEAEVLKHHIGRAREWRKWKLEQAGLSPLEIAKRLSQIDFSTHIDREKILNFANANKQYKLWEDQQRINEKQAVQDKKDAIKNEWNPERMLQEMKDHSLNKLGKPFIMNDHNRQAIDLLCKFVSRHPSFEQGTGFSLNKGLMLRGVSGLGKTHLVTCLKDNLLRPIAIISMLEITDEIVRRGEWKFTGPKGFKIIYFDDVGTEEPTVNYYGTKISFFKDFIELSYLNNSFKNLIISTNANFQQMEEKYGFRVRSRMKDMFNVIDITGEDMRGKN